MNALVTGASGFLGLAITRQLVAQGHHVRALCRRRDPRFDALGVETIEADLRDRRAVVGACRFIDVVFHVAGVAGIWGTWQHFYQTNTRGTEHVVEGCRAHRVRRLVYTSSPSVVFDGKPQEGIDETAPYPRRWLCHYPHSKALAEQHVLSSHGREGLLACALRPHLIWGPGDRHLVPTLLERARQGQLRRVGDGTNRIDMVYIDNAAAAHLQAADALSDTSCVGGRVYFISQGEPVCCWAWINEILALAGLPAVTRSVSLAVAWKVGALLETVHTALRLRREPRMTRFLAAQLGTSHYFDIRRARHDFGYHPHVSTAEGMQRLGAALHEKRDEQANTDPAGAVPGGA